MAKFDEKTGERLDPETTEPTAPAKAPEKPKSDDAQKSAKNEK